ncbi:coadhesin-like [Argopecten irradians]|uniref:coadhesin-like n=1 Tax=Argopecten irradians TaxID=31199 RepID=UPI00370F86AC
MARQKLQLALQNVWLLVLLTCVTQVSTVIHHCLFEKPVSSAANNKLQDLDVDDCILYEGITGSSVSCKKPFSSESQALSLYCLCGGHKKLAELDLDCGRVDLSCCNGKSWSCLNGGDYICAEGTRHKCNCIYPFHGRKCELVYVKRKCSQSTSAVKLPSCESVGESNDTCLYTVNNKQFYCDTPVSSIEANGLEECSQIQDGTVVTPDSVSPVSPVSPVTNGYWSAWSEWSLCSMSNNPNSAAGPCYCRKRECGNGICDGTDIEVSNCMEHGHWTDWTPWSACACTRGGGGQQTRYRFCSNPAPKFGGRSCDGSDYQARDCSHDCPVSESELQMTEFSSWGNVTFERDVPGWLKVRTKLVCQAPYGELSRIPGENVANACYLIKVNVEHCYRNQCNQLKGLRKLIENSSMKKETSRTIDVEP